MLGISADGRWLRYNDSQVTVVSEATMLRGMAFVWLWVPQEPPQAALPRHLSHPGPPQVAPAKVAPAQPTALPPPPPPPPVRSREVRTLPTAAAPTWAPSAAVVPAPILATASGSPRIPAVFPAGSGPSRNISLRPPVDVNRSVPPPKPAPLCPTQFGVFRAEMLPPERIRFPEPKPAAQQIVEACAGCDVPPELLLALLPKEVPVERKRPIVFAVPERTEEYTFSFSMPPGPAAVAPRPAPVAGGGPAVTDSCPARLAAARPLRPPPGFPTMVANPTIPGSQPPAVYIGLALEARPISMRTPPGFPAAASERQQQPRSKVQEAPSPQLLPATRLASPAPPSATGGPLKAPEKAPLSSKRGATIE